MAFVLRFAKGVRNHWKKSLFATGALSYGVSYSKDKYEVNQLMREYCTEASKYGDQLLPLPHEPKRIVVILNQAANKKSAKDNFEKYCEPILQLAGYLIEIVQTDSEGHARRYIEDLPQLPDAILVAGGDGTLSEAVTGLLRRNQQDSCPIGLLPLGRTNAVGKRMFYPTQDPNFVEEVEGIANAAISVIRGQLEKKDAMKIELVDVENPPKPFFAVGRLQWGAYRDILNKRDKYWVTGGLREYFAFLFNVFSGDVTWDCKAKLVYSDPCRGCRNCRVKASPQQQNTRWWAKFVPRAKPSNSGPDYSKIINENCTNTHEIAVSSTDLELSTRNLEENATDAPKLKIKLTGNETGFSFLIDSWRRVWTQSEMKTEKAIDARFVEIRPETESTEDKESFYSIDNEAFEVKPVRISVVPEALQMFVLQKP